MAEWFVALFAEDSIARTVIVYGLVIAIGVWLGRFRILNISIGVTWVLFAGLILSYLGLQVNPEANHFLKEFGLILFVYTIGLQVGPGFFASLRKQGMVNNALTAGVILLGVSIALLFYFIFKRPASEITGVMSGAVTNTPGMGAAQSTALDLNLPVREINIISLAYAVVYPFGIAGIIISLLLLKKIFSVDLEKEREFHRKLEILQKNRPISIHLKIQNPRLEGKSVRDLQSLIPGPFVISRMMQHNDIITPTGQTILHENDILLIVTPRQQLSSLKMIIGDETDVNLKVAPRSELISRIIVVTRPEITHKKINEVLSLQQHNFTLSRVARAGVEMIPHGNFTLQMGDQVKVVGSSNGVSIATQALGNELKRLDVPDLAPIFAGIVMGVILGSIPIYFPGIPIPVRIGLAAGPLIIALLLSKYGNKIYLNQFTTYSANLMLRELGISLFLASVGLGSGKYLKEIFTGPDTLIWIAMGLSITIIPLVTMGMIGKYFFRKRYFEICGLLAGASTDPPALAFSNDMAKNEVAAVNYATVYPLAMILRIIAAQLMIIMLGG